MTAPDAKHMEAARDLFEDPHFRPFRNDHCIAEVAAALAAAEREGMKRAAEIARGGHQEDGSFMFTVEGDAIADTILSEAGEDA